METVGGLYKNKDSVLNEKQMLFWFLSVIKDGLQLPFIRLPYVNKPISSITYQFFKICYFKEGDKPLTEVFSLPPDGMTLNNTYSNVYTEDSECIH